MLFGILIKCMDFFFVVFLVYFYLCFECVLFENGILYIKFYKIEIFKVKKKIFYLKFEGISDCM